MLWEHVQANSRDQLCHLFLCTDLQVSKTKYHKEILDPEDFPMVKNLGPTQKKT